MRRDDSLHIRDIFHNHSVQGFEIPREIVNDRRDQYLFCLHMISLARYNCTVWSGASHNRSPFFASCPRHERKKKKNIKRESDRIKHRYEWPRAPIELPGIPIVISFRPFGAYFYRIGQSAPKLDVSPCASKDDAAIDTLSLRSV